MDASYKIQRGIHVHLIQFFMCPEFWVHITVPLRFYLNEFHVGIVLNMEAGAAASAGNEIVPHQTAPHIGKGPYQTGP